MLKTICDIIENRLKKNKVILMDYGVNISNINGH